MNPVIDFTRSLFNRCPWLLAAYPLLVALCRDGCSFQVHLEERSSQSTRRLCQWLDYDFVYCHHVYMLMLPTEERNLRVIGNYSGNRRLKLWCKNSTVTMSSKNHSNPVGHRYIGPIENVFESTMRFGPNFLRSISNGNAENLKHDPMMIFPAEICSNSAVFCCKCGLMYCCSFFLGSTRDKKQRK